MLGGANIAFAEESGGFVGIGVGYGDAKMLQETTNENTNATDKYKVSANGASYGFVAGYKQFFNEYLGLRYYANLDIYHNINSSDFYLIGETVGVPVKNAEITTINYGVNVDFLGNFVSTEIADFGGFVGFGIGGTTLAGKFISDFKSFYTTEGIKFNDTAFNIWLNVGLRTNIATHHGIELVARVPFLPVKMVDYSYDNAGTTIKLKQTFRQTYNILARYTFSF